MNAAASIAHGGLTYDNAHKLVWGFDQSQNKRKLLGEEEKVQNPRPTVTLHKTHAQNPDASLTSSVEIGASDHVPRKHGSCFAAPPITPV